MRREVYTVVRHGGEWAVCADGQKLLTMASRAQAEAAARAAARALEAADGPARAALTTLKPARAREKS